MRQKAIFIWVGLNCLSCLAGSGSVGASSAKPWVGEVSPEQHKTLARRWIEEGFNKRDLKVVDEIFDEGFAVNGQRIGREGLRQSMRRFLTAFPDLQVTITDIIAEGDKVGMWYSVQGTHRGEFQGVRPTARQVKWSGVDLFRIGGGRIVEARFLDDSLGLLRQLGAMPPPSPSQN